MLFENFQDTETYQILKYIDSTGTLVLFAAETVECIYKKKPFRKISIVTNASRVELAAQFEELDYSKDSIVDAETVSDGIKLSFSIYSPANLTLEQWLHQDAKKRVFRMNAIYYDPFRRNFIDPFEGLEDLKDNKLYLIEECEEILSTDPLIALTAVITASDKGIMPGRNFLTAIRQAVHTLELSEFPIERIRSILRKILTSSHPFIGAQLLAKSGFLDKIFPEISDLKKVPHEKDFHPEGNAYEHTIECFKHLSSPSYDLALATLLHDIGKPRTIQGVKAKFRFPNHAPVGALIAAKMLARLKYPPKTIENVENMVRYHMMPSSIPDLPLFKTKNVLDSEFFPDLMKLYWADLSSSYNPPDNYLRAKSFYEEYLKQKSVYEKYGVKKMR